MQIFVKPQVGPYLTLDVESTDTFDKLKTMIEQKISIPPEIQSFCYNISNNI